MQVSSARAGAAASSRAASAALIKHREETSRAMAIPSLGRPARSGAGAHAAHPTSSRTRSPSSRPRQCRLVAFRSKVQGASGVSPPTRTAPSWWGWRPPWSGRRDRVAKAALYARHGIRHYWVVDPDAHLLEVYELEDGAYRLVVKHEGATRMRTALFPKLEIDLDRVWA